MPLSPLRITGARIAILIVGAAFIAVTRFAYANVIAATPAFEYMGIHLVPATVGVQVLFCTMALLPALWIPLHIARPSDIVELFLYYAVHIPAATLLPLTSNSPFIQQLIFCAALTGALLALHWRALLPRLTLIRAPRVSPNVFWLAVMAYVCVAAWVFVRSGYLSLENASLTDVYGERAELTNKAAEIGRLFFYVSNWTGVAGAPFLILAGLRTKRLSLVATGVSLAIASFIVSSNRMNYMAVPAVVAGYYVLRYTRGRNTAAVMGLVFLALAASVIGLDQWLIGSGVSPIPAFTWQIFHRTFSNNGVISAVYLDTFRSRPFAYYADSFLRALPGPRLEAPVPIIAGSGLADVEGNFANANLWADGYANLGYLGIALSCLFTGLVLWVYDALGERDWLLATAALIVPATVLANTSTHTALTSNGVIFVFLLVYLWPGPEDIAQDVRGARRSGAIGTSWSADPATG